MLPFPVDDLPVINGENVRLRPITDDDTATVVRWRNDPEVQKYFIFREPFTAEMHRSWLRNKVQTGEVVQYIIEDRADGKPLGSVYFRDINAQYESAEYGIFIGETSSRERGIGTETAKLFMDFGFNVLGLHRLSLKILGDNERSQRACENAGYVKEGVFRDMVKLDGEFKDIVFMAKLAEGDD